VIGNDGLVYVCDRNGDRVQVFDKAGKFQRNIWMTKDKTKVPDASGTMWVGFSLDPQQKYMYVVDGSTKSIDILAHKGDQSLTNIALSEDLPSGAHTMAIDSRGNIYVDRDSDRMPRAKANWGRRIQRLTPVSK
jgi:DNA-binding beta-propeller fold protein YncE